MSISYNPSMITDDLVLCLDAANPRSYPGSGSIWYDISGKNNNWTIVNSTHVSPYFTFNGTDSYITSTGISGFNPDNASTTVSVWFQPTATPVTSNRAVFSDNFGPEYGIWYTTTNRVLYAAYGTYNSASTEVPLNTWCNAVLTVTSTAPGSGTTTYDCYLNGQFIFSGSVATGNGMNDNPYNLGRDPAPNYYFTGNISSLALYQNKLNADQIAQNFNALRGRYGI